MKHNIFSHKTTIKRVSELEGETLETTVNRILVNNEPIKDNTPMLYMDRSEGVIPETDIRTDRFDVALDGINKINKSKIAKREEFEKSKNPPKEENIPGTEPPKPAA